MRWCRYIRFGHRWDGCVCMRCQHKRNQNHDWDDCICSRCNEVKSIDDPSHHWDYEHRSFPCKRCHQELRPYISMLIEELSQPPSKMTTTERRWETLNDANDKYFATEIMHVEEVTTYSYYTNEIAKRKLENFTRLDVPKDLLKEIEDNLKRYSFDTER